MLTRVRSDISVAVLRAVRDQLRHPDQTDLARPPSDRRSATDSPGCDTPGTGAGRVRLLRAWLSESGALDVLHIRYEHADVAEPLEYRVEMDLHVEAPPGSRAFARAVEDEARHIVEEISAAQSPQTPLVRRDGHLCWGAECP